jgi:hypothetical protein
MSPPSKIVPLRVAAVSPIRIDELPRFEGFPRFAREFGRPCAPPQKAVAGVANREIVQDD